MLRGFEMKKKTCFFAHNHRDSADEFKKLLKERIIDLSNGEIKVIFDKDDFGVADDVLDKENLIAKSTTVVLFMSPEYKNKIEAKNESRGSYREYKKIIRRLAKNKVFLIPVLVSGNIDSAIPEKLRNIIFQDATKHNMRFNEDDPYLKYSRDKELNQYANCIIDRTNLLYKLSSEKYDNSKEAANN